MECVIIMKAPISRCNKDPALVPFKVPYRWRPLSWKIDGQEYTNERAIAAQQTGFVIVPQMRNWMPDAVGGILCFGVDDADMAVFTPVYCSVLCITGMLSWQWRLYHFSWTSRFWIHNWVANMAYNKYSYMIRDIRKITAGTGEWLQRYDSFHLTKRLWICINPAKELPATSLTTADEATARWKNLGEYLSLLSICGNVKKEKMVSLSTISTDFGFLVSPAMTKNNIIGYS